MNDKTHSERTIEFYNEMIESEEKNKVKRKQMYLCFGLLLLAGSMVCYFICENNKLKQR